ncbi:hypothetical protein [Streptomyces sp. WAC01280]|uniref:hypothetical protein n=1 Tax=Streptomyces sp. WAC01280 TaxID=2487424 RepID=UPI0021AE576F|nr:hypothetical protein [Streptomyces sp. WAC01280]
MEIAELVLKYLETLVWPAVTVGLVWSLRSHIGSAFGRMTRLETPAGAIEFAEEARAARLEAEQLREGPDGRSRTEEEDPSRRTEPERPGRHRPQAGPSRSGAGFGYWDDEGAENTGPTPPSDDEAAYPWDFLDRDRDRGGDRSSTPGPTPSGAGPTVPAPQSRDAVGALPPAAAQRRRRHLPAFEAWSRETDFARSLTSEAPRAAVLRAWESLERFVASLTGVRGAGATVQALEDWGASSGTLQLVRNLTRLRNEAAHDRPVAPSAAHDYVSSCEIAGKELMDQAVHGGVRASVHGPTALGG